MDQHKWFQNHLMNDPHCRIIGPSNPLFAISEFSKCSSKAYKPRSQSPTFNRINSYFKPIKSMEFNA